MTLRKWNSKKNIYTILKTFYTNNKDLIVFDLKFFYEKR